MGCNVKFNDGIGFDFPQNQSKQKIWLEILLGFSKANTEHLAYILDLPIETIMQVHQGKVYLEQEEAKRLRELFLVTFGG